MPILTTKELQALNDQLDFERVELKTIFQICARQHLQNYNTLLDQLR